MSGVYFSTWVEMVSRLSAEVATRMAAAGYPPLNKEIDGSVGSIVIGPQFVAEQGFPPRILMIPRRFDFEANTWDVVNTYKGGTPISSAWNPRPIAKQWKQYEVQCWGCNFTSPSPGVFTAAPDPALDYDAAEQIAEILWQSAHAIAAGVWRSKEGEIDDGAPTHNRVGRVFKFDLALMTPIPDTALGYAPSNVKAQSTVEMIINGQPPAPPSG